jgi:alpha-tubulin suppressor-like RCC1 family protein
MKNLKLAVTAALITASMVPAVSHSALTKISGEVGFHTLYVKDNKAYGVGNTTSGQIGKNINQQSENLVHGRYQTVPVYTGVSNVEAVAAGWTSSYFLHKDGTVSFLGADYGSYDVTNEPVLVPFPNTVLDMAVGLDNAYFLVKTGQHEYTDNEGNDHIIQYGEIYVWDQTDTTSPTPVKLDNSPSEVIMISAGANHQMALTITGDVYTWGSNNYGQLGQGEFDENEELIESNDTPTVVATNVRFIEAGGYHSLVVTQDNTVKAWGKNTSGTVGVGNTGDDVYVPTDVPDLENVWKVNGTDKASYALMLDGSVKMWGWHNLIGENYYNRNYTPVSLQLDVTPAYIGHGRDYGVMMSMDGDMFGWGGNLKGQLALGHTTETHEIGAFLSPEPFLDPNNPVEEDEEFEEELVEDGFEETPTDLFTEPDPEPEVVEREVEPEPEVVVKNNKGHGNNADGVDNDNPGKGNGGPNSKKDTTQPDDDEGIKKVARKSSKKAKRKSFKKDNRKFARKLERKSNKKAKCNKCNSKTKTAKVKKAKTRRVASVAYKRHISYANKAKDVDIQAFNNDFAQRTFNTMVSKMKYYLEKGSYKQRREAKSWLNEYESSKRRGTLNTIQQNRLITRAKQC